VVFDFSSYEKICEWRSEEVKLTSVTISQDSRHMLISMNPDKIKLMEIDTGEVVRSFEGHEQKHFIIRSTFGGANENFIVSGSEGKLNVHLNISPALTCMQIQGYIYGVLTVTTSKPLMLTSAASTAWHGIPKIPPSSPPLATTTKSGYGSLPVHRPCY
jgi:hypothetical protein